MTTQFDTSIISMQVYEGSMFDAPESPELHIQVHIDGFPRRADHVTAGSGGTDWTVREYGDVLIGFTKRGDMQAQFEDEAIEKALAEFNVSGATEFAYFPVRITDWQGIRSKVLFAPVPWVRRALVTYPEVMSWEIVPDLTLAERGVLLWTLVPIRVIDASVVVDELDAKRTLRALPAVEGTADEQNSEG